jgi:hypothetical protein
MFLQQRLESDGEPQVFERHGFVAEHCPAYAAAKRPVHVVSVEKIRRLVAACEGVCVHKTNEENACHAYPPEHGQMQTEDDGRGDCDDAQVGHRTEDALGEIDLICVRPHTYQVGRRGRASVTSVGDRK